MDDENTAAYKSSGTGSGEKQADNIQPVQPQKRDPDAKGSLADSFKYAFEGIFTCIRHERNMKIHCGAAILVTIAGIVLRISVHEWIDCLILFGLVISLEMVNTAIETVVDLVTDEYRPLAKKAKDVAAGAVLVSAIMAAIIGCVIFVPKLIAFFGG